MKNTIRIIVILVILLAISPPFFSQNSIKTVEFWTDGNSANCTRQTISASSVFLWQDEINLASLVDGLHTFNVRFKDEYGVWSPIETRFFVKQTNALGQGELKKITALEYWMNGNSSNRTQRILNGQTTFAWEELIDVAGLSDGVNTFNARFKDEYGVWSPIETRFFVKQTNALGQGELKKITALEYWMNGNSSNRMQRILNGQTTFAWEELIDVAGLSDGVNTFNARFKDEYGVWSPVETRFFLKQTNAAGQGVLKNIAALEYWMNGNSTNRTQRTLNGQTSFTWEELIDVAGIPDGVNTFNVRFKDEYGVWSPIETRFFLKQTNAAGQGVLKKIAALEYWMNGNSANITQRVLNGQTTFSLDELIDVGGIPDGVNTFNARFKDEYGVWSPIETRFFVKQSAISGEGNKKLTTLEYWIDANSTNRISKTFTPSNPYLWEELIPTDDVPNGLHTFNVRWKDDKGIWTMVQTQFFLKDEKKFAQLGENKIVGYRLWFSEEPDYFENIPVAAMENVVSINDSVPLTYLPKGRHQIAYQLKDARGVWSPVITDSIDKPDHALFSFVADKLEIIQGETVKFTPSTKLFIDSIVWSFGDGMTEVNFEPEHKYDSIGKFDVTATVWHKGTNEGVPYTEIKYITVMTTGLLAPEVYTLKMYPVPAKNSLTIESPSIRMNSIQLVTLNGKVIKDVVPENPEKTVLPIGNLQPGTYIIVVKTDKGWLTNKIVKE